MSSIPSVPSVVGERGRTVAELEELSKRFRDVSIQLNSSNQSSAKLIEALNAKAPLPADPTPIDTLAKVVEFVIEAEKVNSVADTIQETQAIKDKARVIREEAARLQVQVQELKELLKGMEKVYEGRQSTLQLTRAVSEQVTTD